MGIDGGDRSHGPHFYWTILTRKDRYTPIEQLATLIEQSITLMNSHSIFLLRTVQSCFINIVKVSKILSQR